MILRLTAATFLLAFVGCQSTGKSSEPDVQTVRVVILAGQSNMGGSGSIADLPAELAAPFEAVPMWDLNGTGWAPMQGEPWAKRKSFGPEIAFAHAVADAGQDIRILKFSKGGTGLVHDWNPAEEGSLYHRLIGHCLQAEVSVAPARIEWAGLLWMQGEQDCKDSTDASAAEAYQDNLENLIARIREALQTPELPVVLGRLHDSLGETKPHVGLDFGQYEMVRAAQVRVAEADEHIEWVDTDEYPLKNDLIHFDTRGCLRLGEDFADVWLKMTAPRPR